MMAKHTPAPWDWMSVQARASGGFHLYLIDADERKIAALWGGADEKVANARLIASAPDHALIGWAMCVQDGTWEEWGPGKGEFCFCGMRYATALDEFGCPVLTPALRAAIVAAQAK